MLAMTYVIQMGIVVWILQSRVIVGHMFMVCVVPETVPTFTH